LVLASVKLLIDRCVQLAEGWQASRAHPDNKVLVLNVVPLKLFVFVALILELGDIGLPRDVGLIKLDCNVVAVDHLL
jgi:hypothetical protein